MNSVKLQDLKNQHDAENYGQSELHRDNKDISLILLFLKIRTEMELFLGSTLDQRHPPQQCWQHPEEGGGICKQ